MPTLETLRHHARDDIKRYTTHQMSEHEFVALKPSQLLRLMASDVATLVQRGVVLDMYEFNGFQDGECIACAAGCLALGLGTAYMYTDGLVRRRLQAIDSFRSGELRSFAVQATDMTGGFFDVPVDRKLQALLNRDFTNEVAPRPLAFWADYAPGRDDFLQDFLEYTGTAADFLERHGY